MWYFIVSSSERPIKNYHRLGLSMIPVFRAGRNCGPEATLFLCSFPFCIVILSSRTDRDKYRTQAHTPLLPATSNKIEHPLADLTLQESLMLVSAIHQGNLRECDISLPIILKVIE